MGELTIYDSQGSPIETESGPSNDRIQDFFFDGVRFAIDRNRKEIVIFFRARDNKTSRSEQYYALFQYSTRSEISNIVPAVEDRIENKYDKFLDTSNEDTKFFELLSSNGSGINPGDASTIQDIKSQLSDYKRVTLGVGKYSEAFGLFSELWENEGCNKIAVSENANGQSVSSYDLVIEKGDYQGLELIGDTKEEIESLREQRRIDLTGSEPETDDSKFNRKLIFGSILGGVGILLFLSIGAIYGACLVFNTPAPGTGLFPFTDDCTLGLSEITAESTDANELQVAGSMSSPTQMDPVTMDVVVSRNNETVYNGNATTNISEDGSFSLSPISFDKFSRNESGEYSVEVIYAGQTKSAKFTIQNSSTTTIETPTVTPTPTPTDTATATPAATATPTSPATATSTSTESTNTTETTN